MRSLVALALTTALTMPPASTAVADTGPPMCGGLAATIVGTDGDDDITGTDGDDVIVGLRGADTINGGRGADRICGGGGADYLEGHGGSDRLHGGAGGDFIDGGVGGCCGPGNTGDDFIAGGLGHDVLHGPDSSATGSTIHGRGGADQIFLYDGGVAYGHKGDDELSQWGGDSVLDGGQGADVLGNAGDPGVDDVTLLGGDGPDTLTTDDTTGTTAMDGGPDIDTCSGGTSAVNCEG
ncbi:hypothetical protein F0U44_05575 [Nocardioides humilatus]|uniref:Hemolysin type calcium-binding protein n=1 Tax=Nocardioides humilatus TaxID=2607660 RepID=A0A5B1LM22_9ACTN|nr:hypothetical protein [Nocardioides humilatus]KAA1421741.1 hypothetical protein F0U44_05575 [Nocardioides humilatus]